MDTHLENLYYSITNLFKTMGMLCEVNSILKLNPSQGYPAKLEMGVIYEGIKEEYRILLVDVPIVLVDENWIAHADVIIKKLVWQNRLTRVTFAVDRIYSALFIVKEN